MKTYVFSIPLLLALSLASCGAGSRERRLMGEGDKIISKIERFREERRRLPESLSEVGIEEKEEGPIYYEKKSDTKFVLWFGMELGGSVIYDSEARKWSR